MTVYRLNQNTRYQQYTTEKSQDELASACWVKIMKGQPLSDEWNPVPVYLLTPDMPASDFFGAPILGRFAISEKVYSDATARKLLESAGELLPMRITETGTFIYVFSLLPKSKYKDAVDLNKCNPDEWDCNYAFKEKKLPPGGIFSIPGSIHAYTVHDDKLAAEKDFVQWYRLKKYTGLDFEEQNGSLPPQSVNPYKKK